jgi:hypothetical protein
MIKLKIPYKGQKIFPHRQSHLSAEKFPQKERFVIDLLQRAYRGKTCTGPGT